MDARELKTRLGTHLDRVRAGETLLVTARGTLVAELRPVGGTDDPIEHALRKLEAKGVVSRGRHTGRLPPFEPIEPAARGAGQRSDRP